MERQDRFFNLEEGEEIVENIKPKKGLIVYFFLKTIPGYSFTIFFIILMLLILITIFIPGSEFLSILGQNVNVIPFSLFLILLFTFLLGIFLVIPLILAYFKYRHQYYWITNKRVIYKKGLIGYSVSSIPLERISDIIISRTFLEGICKFGSLHIQTLAGQISPGKLGAEANLLAIPEPEKTQELIFNLIKRKREEEKITM